MVIPTYTEESQAVPVAVSCVKSTILLEVYGLEQTSSASPEPSEPPEPPELFTRNPKFS